MFWIFWRWKKMVFLSQKDDGNVIFTDYWKVFFSTFSKMGNAFFLSQKVDGKIIFIDYWKGLVLNLSVMENTAFSEPKSCRKDYIYLLFLRFPWYSRTWEIRFFVQCILNPEVDVPLKYLIYFWRSLDLTLINSETELGKKMATRL